MFSRRSLFRGAPAAAFTLGRAARGQSGRKRLLALIGDRYHNADYIRVALDRVLDGIGLDVDYTISYDRLSREMLAGYQVFLCLRDGMIWPQGYSGPDAYPYEAALENRGDFPEAKAQFWIREEQAQALQEFVSNGGGFYSLHNNSHVSVTSKTWREVMGGVYIGHPALRPFRVRVVHASHPITKGIGEFTVNDEQHYVEYDKDRNNVLLEAENVDGLTFQNLGSKSIAGWAYDYGRGRVVFTSVGHAIHALWIPEHVKLQKQAVRWLLREI
jgi:type 1 glutamine amidotransferase